MRGFPMKRNTARLLFPALLMGLLLLAEGTIFAQDTITTFAGSGPATKFDGIGVAVNAAGDVYTTGSTPVSNKWFPAVLKLNATGITLMEGSQSNNPQYGTGVCGQPATNIDPTDMGGVAVDNSGTFYTAMAGGFPPVLRISNGIVSCLEWGSSGLQSAQDVALDNSGNLYFISQDSVGHYLVYKVTSLGTGTPTVVAGTASFGCVGGALGHPYGLALDNRTGNLYVADSGCNVIWKVPPAGSMTPYAGSFTANSDTTSTAGDGGLATNAFLNEPHGVAVDAYGNLYIADFADNRIRKVDSAGIITTIAGSGTPGYAGDSGDATKAELNGPWGIAVGPGGKIYVGDSANNAVRLLTPPGAQMISPPPGSILPEAVTFSWSAVSGATQYQLDVSHNNNIGTIGQGDIVGSARGTIPGTSLQADILCDGRTIYVQLATEIGGAWTEPVQYTYTACQPTVSIHLSTTTLPKQGGAVTVEVVVGTPWEAVQLTVTESTVLRGPCVYPGCPAPKVIQTVTVPQTGTPSLGFPYYIGSRDYGYEVNIPGLPLWYPYEQTYEFSATLTSSSGQVLNAASVRLIQY